MKVDYTLNDFKKAEFVRHDANQCTVYLDREKGNTVSVAVSADQTDEECVAIAYGYYATGKIGDHGRPYKEIES